MGLGSVSGGGGIAYDPYDEPLSVHVLGVLWLHESIMRSNGAHLTVPEWWAMGQA